MTGRKKRTEKRRHRSAAFKARLARAALREEKTAAQPALEGMADLCRAWAGDDGGLKEVARGEAMRYKGIGRLKLGLDWLRKRSEGLG